MAVSAYSTTASDNTSISGITVSNATTPDALDNIIRQMMADIRAFYDSVPLLSGTSTFTGTVDLTSATVNFAAGEIATADLADDCVTRVKIADAAMSGADATLITGTKGTAGNLASWNADGDLIGSGYNVLDEDAMSSNSATGVPTQQSVKAYVDAQAFSYSTSGPTTATGASVEFSAIPSGISRLTIMLRQVEKTDADNLLIQFRRATAYQTSAYVSQSGGASSTSAFIIDGNAVSDNFTGLIEFVREPGTNTWISNHTLRLTNTTDRTGGGHVVLTAALNGLRITCDGAATFSGGSVSLQYS